jgi:hypothetical protein
MAHYMEIDNSDLNLEDGTDWFFTRGKHADDKPGRGVEDELQDQLQRDIMQQEAGREAKSPLIYSFGLSPLGVPDKPFKLCMVRVSNPKAVVRGLDVLNYHEFISTIRKYLYEAYSDFWVIKVFVNEDAYKRNIFHVIERSQARERRMRIFEEHILPCIKSGQFLYIGTHVVCLPALGKYIRELN